MAKDRKKLTQQQKLFVREFRKDGDRIRAYREAGYRGATKDGKPSKYISQYSYHILNLPQVQDELDRLDSEDHARQQARDTYTLDWLRERHLDLLQASLAKGDMASATRNLEGIGRTMGAYKEGLQINTERIKEFSDKERREIKRITAILLDSKPARLENLDQNAPGEGALPPKGPGASNT